MTRNRENMGRPAKYNKAEELDEKINEYFANKDIPIKTITGLVLFCGFCDRQSFYAYEKKEEFSHSIKDARTRIENVYEKRLQGNNCTGSIFALKNFGWIDKTETDITSGGKPLPIMEVKNVVQENSSDNQDKQSKEED